MKCSLCKKDLIGRAACLHEKRDVNASSFLAQFCICIIVSTEMITACNLFSHTTDNLPLFVIAQFPLGNRSEPVLWQRYCIAVSTLLQKTVQLESQNGVQALLSLDWKKTATLDILPFLGSSASLVPFTTRRWSVSPLSPLLYSITHA